MADPASPVRAPGAGAASGGKDDTGRRPVRTERWLPYVLIGPAALLLCVVMIFPLAVAIYSSFFDVSMINLRRMTFVGVDNYVRLAGDGSFYAALGVTALYTLAVVVGAYLLALAIALLLQKRFRGRGVARTLAVMPWAVPPVVAVLVWVWMLDTNFGVVNYVLDSVGVGAQPWLERGDLALVAVIMVSIWVLCPVAITMLMAGLQSIDDTLYEAAAVDGAGAVARFRHITLPGLAPINVVLILLLVLMAFTRVVTIIYVMTGGGPGGATETLPLQTYLQAFKYRDLGYASTVGVAVLVVAMVISGAYYVVAQRLAPKVDS